VRRKRKKLWIFLEVHKAFVGLNGEVHDEFNFVDFSLKAYKNENCWFILEGREMQILWIFVIKYKEKEFFLDLSKSLLENENFVDFYTRVY